MGKEQREYLLRQQMKAIQQELGESSPEQAEVEQLAERLAKADLPEDVRKEAERELSRMRKLPQGAPDYHVIRTYLDYVLELPWRIATQDQLDIGHAREVLDNDHFGLKDVAKPRSDSRSLTPSAASSSGLAWVDYMMKRSCADTGAPTSARCPDASFRRYGARVRITQCS
jgi:ATP-dependent Lon protease